MNRSHERGKGPQLSGERRLLPETQARQPRTEATTLQHIYVACCIKIPGTRYVRKRQLCTVGGATSLNVRKTRGLARWGKQTRETLMTRHGTYMCTPMNTYQVCTSISPRMHTYCYNRVSYKMIYSRDACSTFFLEIKKAKNPTERERGRTIIQNKCTL